MDSISISISNVSKGKSDSLNNPERILIDEAANGKEALELFKRNFENRCGNDVCPHPIYRLVIMDLNMPVMDGFEATKEILKMRSDSP